MVETSVAEEYQPFSVRPLPMPSAPISDDVQRQSEDRADSDDSSGDEITNGELFRFKQNGSSIIPFGTSILKTWKNEEYTGRNCSGTRGKKNLSRCKMKILETYVALMYPEAQL